MKLQKTNNKTVIINFRTTPERKRFLKRRKNMSKFFEEKIDIEIKANEEKKLKSTNLLKEVKR